MNFFPSSVPRKATIAFKSDTSILAIYIYGDSGGNSPSGLETAGARTLSTFQVLNAVHQGVPLIPGILVSVRYLSYSSVFFYLLGCIRKKELAYTIYSIF